MILIHGMKNATNEIDFFFLVLVLRCSLFRIKNSQIMSLIRFSMRNDDVAHRRRENETTESR